MLQVFQAIAVPFLKSAIAILTIPPVDNAIFELIPAISICAPPLATGALNTD
ncbi:hypothetical protein KBT16_27630 [Nostoc sp. CCCryo 231-06]|nr:hypothetical protein [Nostoc sp. CCCryo 231-06]